MVKRLSCLPSKQAAGVRLPFGVHFFSSFVSRKSPVKASFFCGLGNDQGTHASSALIFIYYDHTTTKSWEHLIGMAVLWERTRTSKHNNFRIRLDFGRGFFFTEIAVDCCALLSKHYLFGRGQCFNAILSKDNTQRLRHPVPILTGLISQGIFSLIFFLHICIHEPRSLGCFALNLLSGCLLLPIISFSLHRAEQGPQ